MNWEAWKPLATLVFTTSLKFAGGLLVAHGLATNGPGLEALGGAATTAAGSLWSWWVQRGHVAAGDWLKHLTDTATQAAAIEVAKRMSPASATGAAASAKAEVKAIEPAVMAKDAANAVVKVLLIAFALSAFLAVPSAQAQGLKLKPLPDPIAKLKQDFQTTTGVKPTGDVPFDLLKALDKALLPDLKYAQKLATATGSKVTAPCYQAWIDMIQTQQTAVMDPPVPPATEGSPTAEPDPDLVTKFERMVELRNALQPDSPFMTACSPVANMVKLDVTAFMGIVISGGAGLATLVPGL